MTGDGTWGSFGFVGLGWWGNELANAVERSRAGVVGIADVRDGTLSYA